MTITNYVGITFIVLGFTAPYFTGGFNPCTILFWVGFILLLTENEKLEKWNTIIKYGKMGLLFNIALTLLLMIIFKLSLVQNKSFYTYSYFIINPINFIIDKTIPLPITELPDGSLLFTPSHFRKSFTNFLNLLFFIAAGILTWKYIQNNLQKQNLS